MDFLGVFTVEKKYVEKTVSIILRVPALFILEACYKPVSSMSLQGTGDIARITLVAYYSVVLFAIVVATISLQHLVTLYMYLISLGSVVAACYLSDKYVKEEDICSTRYRNTGFTNCRDYGVLNKTFLYFFAQCIIATVISWVMDIKDWTKYTLLIFTLPICARLLGIPVKDLNTVHTLSTIFITFIVLLYTLSKLPQSFRIIHDGIDKLWEAITEAGWIPVIVTYWHDVVLPVQLLLFWSCFFMSQMYVYYQIIDIFTPDGIIMLLVAMSECCSTPISLFALCITLSYLSYYVLTMAKVFLLGWEGLVQDNDISHGWREGFVMLIIALQNGLLQITIIQRAFLISIMLFIVVSSLVQSMCEMTDEVLLKLNVGHMRNICKQIRVLALCMLLCVLPLYLTYQICHYYDFDFWMVIIISNCILMPVQVIGSLLVYCLFFFDSLRAETWEQLDDVIYYIRSTVCILQFICAVVSACFGIYNSIYANLSWIHTGLLIKHCYYDVWKRLQSGWETFLLRREAVHTIESLPEASTEQLSQHNDVCAICYQEMNSGRITPCGHYFHGCCLRKWLYVKDLCPLCHQAINVNLYLSSTSSNTETNNGNVNPSNIDINPSDIDVNNIDIDVNTSDIDVNSSDIDVNTSDIDVNISDIDVNISDIDVNTSDVDVNISDIDVNTSDVDVNTSDIDVNTSDIDVNTSDVDVNTSDIDVNTSDIDVNPSNMDVDIYKSIIDLQEPDENRIESKDQESLKGSSDSETPADVNEWF